MENKPRTTIEQIEKEEQKQLAIIENATKDVEVLLAKKNKAKPEESAPEIEKPIKTTGTVETLDEKIGRLGREIQTGTEDLEKTDNKITQIGNKLEELNKRSEEIDNKIEVLNKRSEEIDNKIKVEQDKIEKVNARIAEIEEQLKTLLGEPEKIKPETIIKEELKTEKTEKTQEEEIEQKMEDSLTVEEQKTVQDEMEKSTPELFEPEEVKKNRGLFLRNLVVESVSIIGRKIKKNLKEVASKLRNKVLFGTVIISLFTATSSKDGTASYVVPRQNPDGSKNVISMISQEEMESKTLKEYLDFFHVENTEQMEQLKQDMDIKGFGQFELAMSKIDTSLYNKLGPNERRVYLYGLTNETEPWLLTDKPNSRIYVIDEEGKEIADTTVCLGATKGEMPNTADLEGNRYTETTTTPAGKHTLGTEITISKEDSILYGGKVISIDGTYYAPNSTIAALHVVYPLELELREAAIRTPNPDDNRVSWGCINVPKAFWDKYIAPYIHKGSTIYITPDFYQTTTLNPRTGEVEQISPSTDEAGTQRYDYKSKI